MENEDKSASPDQTSLPSDRDDEVFRVPVTVKRDPMKYATVRSGPINQPSETSQVPEKSEESVRQVMPPETPIEPTAITTPNGASLETPVAEPEAVTDETAASSTAPAAVEAAPAQLTTNTDQPEPAPAPIISTETEAKPTEATPLDQSETLASEANDGVDEAASKVETSAENSNESTLPSESLLQPPTTEPVDETPVDLNQPLSLETTPDDSESFLVPPSHSDEAPNLPSETSADQTTDLADLSLSKDAKTTEAAQEPIEKPKKKRGKTVLISALVFLLIAALAVGAYYLFFLKPASEKKVSVKNQNSNMPKPVSITSEELIKRISTTVPGGNSEKSATKLLAPPFKVTGADFATRVEPDASLVYSTADIAAMTSLTSQVETNLVSYGLRYSVDNVAKTVSSTEMRTYRSDAMNCGLANDSSSAQKSLTVVCAENKSYESASKEYRPFFDAYKEVRSASVKSGANELILFYPTTLSTNSQSAGYQTAVFALTQSGKIEAAQFYQKPDKTWQFFTVNKLPLACNDFSTKDLKLAYAGTNCTLPDGAVSSVKQ